MIRKFIENQIIKYFIQILKDDDGTQNHVLLNNMRHVKVYKYLKALIVERLKENLTSLVHF